VAVHTFVLTPYYSWRVTHSTHHVCHSWSHNAAHGRSNGRILRFQKATNNLDRDETYVPLTRKDFNLPDGKVAIRMDYTELLEETPAFTIFKMFIRQFL